MQFGERNAGTPRVGDELTDERAGLLGAFPRAPSRRELAHEGAGAVPDFDEALCLEVFIRLNDRRGIDPQLGSQLPDGRERRRGVERARRDRQAHALGDLDIKRNGTARIDTVKHGRLAFQCISTL